MGSTSSLKNTVSYYLYSLSSIMLDVEDQPPIFYVWIVSSISPTADVSLPLKYVSWTIENVEFFAYTLKSSIDFSKCPLTLKPG